MIRHIVAWNFKEGFSDEEKQSHALKIKADLEALKGVVPEIIDMKVYIDHASTSDRKLALDSLFNSEQDLANYMTNPEHKKVAQYINSVMTDRACFDWKE